MILHLAALLLSVSVVSLTCTFGNCIQHCSIFTIGCLLFHLRNTKRNEDELVKKLLSFDRYRTAIVSGNKMRYFIIATISFSFFALQSCKTSLADYATDWSNSIKAKIVEDASQQPDKTIFDSSSYNVTLYKGGHKLKFFHLNPKFNDNGQLISLDTAVSIFYSSDQNFELVRELCPYVDRSFEGVRYKGEHLGLEEFRYCDGKIKESGFRFNGDIGIWKEYDTHGKVIKETDYGNFDRLEKLKGIRYYR
jgi:hypothetical protein